MMGSSTGQGSPIVNDPIIEDLAKFSNHHYMDIKEEKDAPKSASKSPKEEPKPEGKQKQKIKFQGRRNLASAKPRMRSN